jgi:Protein of unknown function (DUF2793)
MADTTANLQLPFILPSQAQKHVTHNEALVILDRLVQLIIEYEGSTPPSLPQEGQRFSVAGTATGAWSGRAGTIAIYQDGIWLFATPRHGYLAWFKDQGAIKVFSGSGWASPALPDTLTPSMLGIGATPDASNRLAVTSPATLLNNAGAGHQLKINKAAAGDTASLLFQTGWSGRAEMGLAGNDQFSVKVSADGSSWNTGLVIDGGGRISMPNRPLARAHRAAGTSTPAAGTETGFTTLALQQGGVTLGTTAAGGGNALTVPADGLYLISANLTASASSGYTVEVRRNGSATLMAVRGPTAVPLTTHASGVFQLYAGDLLTFLHAGAVTLDEGAGKTELSILRL